MKKSITILLVFGVLGLVAPMVAQAAVTVTISSPSAGATITTLKVMVNGTAGTDVGKTIDSITVNGVAVDFTSAQNVSYAQEIYCANTITVVAIDSAGSSATKEINITCTTPAAVGKVPSDCFKVHKTMTYTEHRSDGTVVTPIPSTCAAGQIMGPHDKTTCTFKGNPNTDINCHSKNWGLYSLINIISYVTDWIFIILMIVAGLLIIIAAFMFLTAAGSPEKVTGARNMIIFAAIGVVVALLSRAVVPIVRAIAGM